MEFQLESCKPENKLVLLKMKKKKILINFGNKS